MSQNIFSEEETVRRQLSESVDETTFNRVVDWVKNNEIALITAFRGKKENVADPKLVKDDGKAVGENYSHKENRERNRELGAALLRLGYGITKVNGVYIENFGMPNARHSNEDSFLVVNRNNDPDFLNNVFSLSEYFNQDCFCYKPKDDDTGYNIGTNKSEYPGYGNRDANSKFVAGVKNEFMTRVGNKGFAFTDKDNLEKYGTSHKKRKQERMDKRTEDTINKDIDTFDRHNVMGKQAIAAIADDILKEAVGETSRRQKAVQAMNGVNGKIRTIAILTSENLRFKDNVDKGNKRKGYGNDNEERRNDLEKHLKVGHYAWFPVKGQYEGKDNSYMIYNISLEDAQYLGQKYGQQSIIWIDGPICQYWEQYGGGKYHMTHERPMRDRIDMTDADDLYTQISRSFKFQIPFFDGSDENKAELANMNEHVECVIRRRVPDDAKADLFFETCLSGKSGFNKYADRSKLYGNNFQEGYNGNMYEWLEKVNSLNERVNTPKGKTLLKEDLDSIKVPKSLPHTDNAFREGENLYLRRQATVNGKVKWIERVAKILKVLPKDIQIELNGKTYTIPKQFDRIKCTDTWLKVFDSLNNGATGDDREITPYDIKFDYRVVDGEDSVVVTIKQGMKNPMILRFRYDDVRQNLHSDTPLKPIPMKFQSEEANTGLWLKPGDIKPIKSKNPIEGAVNVKREWVATLGKGTVIGGSVFHGWLISKADEICSECPWLSQKPAVWVDESGERKISKKTTPDKFFEQ